MSHLHHLIETCKDGQDGFRAAAEHVKNPGYESLFSELGAERARFVTELQQLGDGTDKSGSVVSALHRGWINLKAALSSGDEHAILAECERGEDYAVAAYRDALDDRELPANIRAVVQRQSVAVQAAHDRVRDLRDANQS